MLFKVKCDGKIGLPIFNFLFVLIVTYGQTRLLCEKENLEFDLSMWLKVKSDGAVEIAIFTSY